MRIGAGVNDKAVGSGRLGLEPVDQGALAVGLEGPHLGAVCGGPLLDELFDVGEGLPTVDLRFAGAQGIQVWAVYQEDSHRGIVSDISRFGPKGRSPGRVAGFARCRESSRNLLPASSGLMELLFMGKDIDEDLIEATIRRIQAQAAPEPDAADDEEEDPIEATIRRVQAQAAAQGGEPAPGAPVEVDEVGSQVEDPIAATIRRVREQVISRGDEGAAEIGAADEESPAEDDAFAATIARVQAQAAARAEIPSEFAPAPLPPLDDEPETNVIEEAIHFAEAHDDGASEHRSAYQPAAWRDEAPPIEETAWPGRDERMLGEPATWQIAAQRLEQGLQETQQELRSLAARLEALMPALQGLAGNTHAVAPSLTVIQPKRKAAQDEEWDDTPRVAPMQFGTPPRPPVFRDPSPQTATAAELVEEPTPEAEAVPAASGPRLHAVDAKRDLDSRLPRQYRITVEDKRRGVDLVPLHRAMQGLEHVKDMSLLSYSNGVAIVLVESVGAIDPEALRAAVERAMSRETKIEVHNEQTMVVKIQEA